MNWKKYNGPEIGIETTDKVLGFELPNEQMVIIVIDDNQPTHLQIERFDTNGQESPFIMLGLDPMVSPLEFSMALGVAFASKDATLPTLEQLAWLYRRDVNFSAHQCRVALNTLEWRYSVLKVPDSEVQLNPGYLRELSEAVEYFKEQLES